MSKENTQLAEKQEQGIDEILSDIKEVITNKNPAPQEDVLELTEVIEEVKAANESKQPAPIPTPEPVAAPVAAAIFEPVKKAPAEPVDILAKLDSATAQPQMQSFANSHVPANQDRFNSTNSASVENIIDEAVIATSRQTLKNFMKMTEKNEIDTLKLRSGNTVEDIIIELMKPQLSEWLNKNLPALVASVVEKEIKKLVPKDE